LDEALKKANDIKAQSDQAIQERITLEKRLEQEQKKAA
jgi:hypothetical protein